jgi:uncharacterized protein YifE (UPF0438 family)
MQTIFNVYDQLANLIANLGGEQLLNFKASEEIQNRYGFLLNKKMQGSIEPEEKDELDHFIVLERLFRAAKIKAEKNF